MIATIEMSLYPLQESYKPAIRRFIKSLHDHDDLRIVTNEMSTYVTGSLTLVLQVVSEELEELYKSVPKYVLTLKIIPLDLKVEKGFITIE